MLVLAITKVFSALFKSKGICLKDQIVLFPMNSFVIELLKFLSCVDMPVFSLPMTVMMNLKQTIVVLPPSIHIYTLFDFRFLKKLFPLSPDFVKINTIDL